MILYWEKILIPYEQAVEELKVKFKAIRNEYRRLDEYSPIEFVTGRVKAISSIIDKARLRDVPLDRIEEEIEDIAGIRIMCQLVDDIEKVVQLIRDRDGKDIKIVEERDYITNIKESGYRSYHIIIKYKVHTVFGEKEILAEIQIRTLAMNFWATIEHSLNYKFSKNIPKDIKERLKNAAEAAFLLDKEMSEIRDDIVDAQELFQMKSSLIVDILRKIQNLYFTGRIKEFEGVQERFLILQEIGDVNELKKFSRELDNMIL
ncbi:putative GTP pyrophosphokinase [Proteiniborus ethanoligenes]|uniref:Putative GTP pyrophosphokinase n=1 Tax=Proteiniborus ethanoligenes TaxID=415015 RepID=A0A1H3LEM0_9FIRM|nr:GTP pyrophosphokinase family protein [Proteiniborus ethanoligenes]TAH64016.1 MAG: GTP pyrophosphokinase family protein [Gottschalkiaceae bacterium]SDY62831.1 putative GTP pyrophosphokinase [Proteiniborus ethanoligenes]